MLMNNRIMESSSPNSRLICVIPDGVLEDGEVKAALIETAFHLPGNTHLELKVHGWEDKAVEYLDHAVVRTPGGSAKPCVARVFLHQRIGRCV